MKRITSKIEILFEQIIWNYRFIVIIAVISLLISTAIAFYFGIIHTIESIQGVLHGEQLSNNYILINLISSLDNFLLGLVLMIIAFGIYELFISNINVMEKQIDFYPNWLKFHSLDELKSVLSKIIIIIMIVYFFKTVLTMNFETPISIIYLAAGILLVAIANYLSHQHKYPLFASKNSSEEKYQ